MSDPTGPTAAPDPAAGLADLADLDPDDLRLDDLDAVVFDMGGVFVIPHPEPLSVALAAAGVDRVMTDAEAHRAHYAGVRGITEHLLVRGHVDEGDLDVWSHYDHASYATLGLEAEVLVVVARHRGDLRRGRSVGGVWRHLLPENIGAFARIAEALPVAVVSNNDGTAEDQCRRYGICQVGPGALPSAAAIVDSGVVGIAKPDPRIFAPALEALGTPPERVLYVGDTVHADVRGATAAGMRVVQIDPYDDHHDHDHWRVPDVVALADRLLG